MIIYAADDEITALHILTRAIGEAVPDAEVFSFQTASDLLSSLESASEKPDIAFLDIEMPGMTGIELAKRIMQSVPDVNIVFVTGFSQYALDAISVRPSGYVMKPVDKERILTEIHNLRHPPRKAEAGKRIRIQCFGDFGVFVDGRAVSFTRSKSKEMLAYLVDRNGAGCSSARIAEALWETGVYDRARQKLFSTIYADMVKSLRKVNADNIIKKTGSLIAVDTSAFDCDYYLALSGDALSINSFMGEYMAAYSWAEFTTASLFNILAKEQAQ